jgi:hypothetical protein
LRCTAPPEAVKSYRDDEAEVIDLALAVLLNDVQSYDA